MSKPVLAIVIGSTRPGRVGPKFAAWFRSRAIDQGGFDVDELARATALVRPKALVASESGTLLR